ncbi:aspartyl protease family protein [Synechococcus sp. CS-1325]|uniref:aspartyl protease family protein n=1 Tax=unclassified Synechococcus TaxID=2626047 RepID=UPI000DAF624B|nr:MULTISPECIES: aspartyl protease family protein [unclassified Synechococcus]PZU99105.1 MAG: hypothetical protein DCF24_09690 [Cyanobium sp.]MCT0200370.1 aspartyl protease family protein [Synechococcus sp. CS-1325]MCT0213990.1 aspartyl protease family protein [Synechococcus sp. CS-1326]MCT0230056.1 aspartyl protease family protein [Synechococcus sp. CS-1324]MCT0233566.1 aspartyl protease family protein [Synechococcus sp. CS-1327]
MNGTSCGPTAQGWSVALLLLLPASSLPAAAALIQVRGIPLAGGIVTGQVSVPLERAEGGDAPVLRFRTERGAMVALLVDTGASSTLVSPDLAKRLGLRSQLVPPEAFGLAGAGADCAELQPRRARLPLLRLDGQGGQLQIRGSDALVLAVPGLPAGIDGVLGAPLLRQLPLWIDPTTNQLSLGGAALRAAERKARARAPLELPLRWEKGVPLLVLWGASGPLPALADTGAEGLFVTPELAARLQPLGSVQAVRLSGFCGEQPASLVRLAGLRLEPGPPGAAPQAPFAPLEAIVTRNPVFAALGVEAIVGQELLRDRIQLWRLEQMPPVLSLW